MTSFNHPINPKYLKITRMIPQYLRRPLMTHQLSLIRRTQLTHQSFSLWLYMTLNNPHTILIPDFLNTPIDRSMTSNIVPIAPSGRDKNGPLSDPVVVTCTPQIPQMTLSLVSHHLSFTGPNYSYFWIGINIVPHACPIITPFCGVKKQKWERRWCFPSINATYKICVAAEI